MMTDRELLALHREMVGIPSVSGSETTIADFVEHLMSSKSWNVRRIGNSVVAFHGPGPYLLLNSHLDTVPICDGWSRDPYQVDQIGDVVYGLGSNDAKGAAAAMLAAFDRFVTSDEPGSVAIALVEGEETRGIGTTNVFAHFDQNNIAISSAIIGEPTELNIAIAQKGLLIFELHAKGTSCHAARATEVGAVNPLETLANDVLKIRSIDWSKVDPFLGKVSVQPTMISGGTAKNQVPGLAKVVYDVRTTNSYSHDEVLSIIEEIVDSDIHVVSKRLEPVGTPRSAEIVQAACAVREKAVVFGSATMSDMVFVRDVPAIKVGPGKSARSHTPDEFIRASEIVEGASFYSCLINSYMNIHVKQESQVV